MPKQHRIQAYRSLETALQRCNGGPILRVGDLYLVGNGADGLEAYERIELLGERGRVAALVTPRHLDRLGNANHARADHSRDREAGRYFVFPQNGTPPAEAAGTDQPLKAVKAEIYDDGGRWSADLHWSDGEIWRAWLTGFRIESDLARNIRSTAGDHVTIEHRAS